MPQLLQVQGNFTNDTGTVSINTPISVTTPINQVLRQALSSGFNSIPIPTGTTFIHIILPVGNVIAVTLKGVTGDTGIPLAPAGYASFSPAPASTAFGLTTGAAITALTTIYFE